MPASSTPPVSCVLVGATGFRGWHLRNIDRLRRAGAPVRLAGVCEPQPLGAPDRALIGDAPVSARLADLLDLRPDVTIVATPIHTHADLALAAAAAGSHVLLEKPPTPSMAAFERLVAQCGRAGSPARWASRAWVPAHRPGSAAWSRTARSARCWASALPAAGCAMPRTTPARHGQGGAASTGSRSSTAH